MLMRIMPCLPPPWGAWSGCGRCAAAARRLRLQSRPLSLPHSFSSKVYTILLSSSWINLSKDWSACLTGDCSQKITRTQVAAMVTYMTTCLILFGVTWINLQRYVEGIRIYMWNSQGIKRTMNLSVDLWGDTYTLIVSLVV